MAIRDLVPWSRSQELAPARGNYDPLMTLHREMNRLFDDESSAASVGPACRRSWKDSSAGQRSNLAKPTRR